MGVRATPRRDATVSRATPGGSERTRATLADLPAAPRLVPDLLSGLDFRRLLRDSLLQLYPDQAWRVRATLRGLRGRGLRKLRHRQAGPGRAAL